MTGTSELAADALHTLRSFTNPERKRFTEGYFPSALENLGVAVPDLRKVVRQLSKALRGRPARDALAVSRELLRQGTLEGRQVAYEVLAAHAEAAASLGRGALEALGKGLDNWTSVDVFACSLSGPAWRAGRLGDADVSRWVRSQDRWWRRAALVSTVPLNLASRGGTGDPVRTLSVCRRLAADSDEMVAKALSWALRSLIEHDRDAVRQFLLEYEDDLARRVLREVGSKLETGLKTRRRKA